MAVERGLAGFPTGYMMSVWGHLECESAVIHYTCILCGGPAEVTRWTTLHAQKRKNCISILKVLRVILPQDCPDCPAGFK